MALADVVVLKSGWKAEGTVTETKDHVVVELKSGMKVKYSRSDVVRIIRKDTPRDTFLKKYDAVDKKNLQALESLATWCRVRGLGAEAVRVARDMLAINADNEFAKNILIRFKMTVEHIPTNKERAQQLVQEFGTGFKVYRSRHYRICYNTDLDYAKERGKCFERLYEQFYRYFDEMGFPMPFLEDRVEVVLFRSREQYMRYAAGKYPSLVRSAGFYSQTENRAVFFDGKGEAYYRAFQKQYAKYMRELRNLKNRMASLRRGTKIILQYGDGRKETLTRGGLKRKVSAMQKDARAQWRKFRDERQGMNLSTAMHESAHQLSFNLGLLPMQGRVPRWLAEGFATFFEETKPERKVETSGISKRWLTTYKKSRKPGLRKLLTDDMVWMKFDKETETAYSQAWALFYFLGKNHNKLFVTYLKDFMKNTGKADTPEGRVADFVRAFGPLSLVERDWRSAMTSVRAK